MSISPVSMSSAYRNNSVRFKGTEESVKPKATTPQKADDEVVGYGTCGPNYRYPVTAGQLKIQEDAQKASEAARAADKSSNIQESPEDYYRRKLYSTEWTT